MVTYQMMGDGRWDSKDIVQFNSFYQSICHNHTPGLFLYFFWSEDVIWISHHFSNADDHIVFPSWRLWKKVFVVGVNWLDRIHLDKQLYPSPYSLNNLMYNLSS